MNWLVQNLGPRLRFAVWNPAFSEPSAEVRAARFHILRGVGFLQKNLP